MDDQHYIQDLLKNKRRRLQVLELQAARHGSDAPPHILLEIDDLRQEIATLQLDMGSISSPNTKWDELASIAYKLAESVSFLAYGGSSADILPDLRRLYGRWLQTELKAVRITQKDNRVLLEVTRHGKGPFSDPDVYEHTILTDLGFIADDTDPFFPPEKAVQENAKKFIEKLDPYSMIMSGVGEYFLTKEGSNDIAKLYESSYSNW